MSIVFGLGLAVALAFGSPQGQQAAQSGARQVPPASSPGEPAPEEIGDEPGVVTGHGPIRHTPVPGVKFRTAAPGGSEPIEPEPETSDGRPVGQPAAAGLGAHVQRGEAAAPAASTPPRTPD